MIYRLPKRNYRWLLRKLRGLFGASAPDFFEVQDYGDHLLLRSDWEVTDADGGRIDAWVDRYGGKRMWEEEREIKERGDMDREARAAELRSIGQGETVTRAYPLDETPGDRVASQVYGRFMELQDILREEMQGMDRNMSDVAEAAGRLVDAAAKHIPKGDDYHGVDFLSQIGFDRMLDDIDGADFFDIDGKLRALEQTLLSHVRDLERGAK